MVSNFLSKTGVRIVRLVRPLPNPRRLSLQHTMLKCPMHRAAFAITPCCV